MDEIILNDEEMALCKLIIENSIKTRVEKTGVKGVVLAMSGGVDSSLVAAFASNVVNVYALILPEVGINLPEDMRHAEDLAKSLNIDYEIININDILEAVYRFVPKKAMKANERLAYANAKPRIRMVLSYFTANYSGRLVLGTGNKTELLIGYSTKYGDGGVDIQPIGDLYKSQVWQMAEYLKLPEIIVKKAATAGLWEGQTDESEIGMKYRDIDRILFRLVEKGFSVKETATDLGIEVDAVEKIHRRIRMNEHKRHPPTITKLSSICLDKDWRYPVESSY